MKAIRLLVGVAALALISTAAQAGDVYHASMSLGPTGVGPLVQLAPGQGTSQVGGSPGTLINENTFGSFFDTGRYIELVADTNMNTNSNYSLIEIIGFSAANNGTAETNISESFTLSGTVAPDCSFFVGNVDQSIDFGTIGIEARDNVGPASAFDMTAPATASIQTNVAGCNTRNRVTVEKGRATGMRSDSNAGFDQTQFTNDLDYTVDATWSGSNPNGGAQAPTSETLSVGLNDRRNSTRQGAWKSVFNLDINVPVPTLSLLAGEYEDTLTVTLDVI